MNYSDPDHVPPTWKVGDVILNKYEVREVFESGGMGFVYRVYHRDWNLELAVKSPRPELFQTQEQIENFEREAETWVNLGLHPHVVTCYYVRRLGGIPRIFAEFVEGGTLSEWIRDGRLYQGTESERLARVLDVAIQVAWGLNYAHEKGLVHQDVKPLNVLMTPDGVAKVSDFGLASASRFTHTKTQKSRKSGQSILVPGSGFLTPQYASPEQFRGESLTQRSDIWSWALLVMEMLKGECDWADGRFAPHVLENFYAENCSSDPIARVLAECLHSDVTARMGSFTKITTKLITIYEGLAQQGFGRVAPESLQLSSDSLNNRAVSLLDLDREDDALTTFEAALASSPSHLQATYNRGLLLWRKSKISDDDFLTSVATTNPNEVGAGTRHYWLGLLHLERGDFQRATAILRRAWDEFGELEARKPWEISISLLAKLPNDRVLTGHLGEIWAVAISEDGSRVVSGAGFIWKHSEDGKSLTTFGKDTDVRLWDFASGNCLQTYKGHTDEVTSVAISKSGRIAISGSYDKTLRVWDLENNCCLHVLPGHSNRVTSVAISDCGQFGVTASDDTTARLWDLSKGACLHVFRSHEKPLTSVLITPDASQVITAGFDCLRFWNSHTGECIRTINIRAHTIASSQDGGLLVASIGRYLQLIDVKTGTLLSRLAGAREMILCVAVSADGRWALSGDRGGTVRWWCLTSGRCLRTIQSKARMVKAVAISKCGRWALAGGQLNSDVHASWLGDGLPSPYILCRPSSTTEHQKAHRAFTGNLAAAQHQMRAGNWRGALQNLREAKKCHGYSQDYRLLRLIAEVNRRGVKSRIMGGFCRAILSGHSNGIKSVTVSPDGSSVISASDDKTIRLWSSSSGECLQRLSGHEGRVSEIALTPDGTQIVSASRDNTIRIWDVETGNVVAVQQGFIPSKLGIQSVAISPDGLKMVSVDHASLCERSAITGRFIRIFYNPSTFINAVAYSPDSQWIVSVGGGFLCFWDACTSKWIKGIKMDSGHLSDVVISPDGTKILAASWDNGIRLFDVNSGEFVRSLVSDGRLVSCVKFTPDGKFAVSGANDGVLRVWNLDAGECILTLRGHTGGINSVAVAPDGSWLASGSDDRTIRIWELDWLVDFPDAGI